MSKKLTRGRVFWREQGGARRAYGDFRDYADVGGKREALVVPRDRQATSDANLAEVLAARRLDELNRLRAHRQAGAVHDLPRRTTLLAFAREHLIAKAKAGKATESWVAETEHCLARAIEHFGSERDLSAITAADMRRWTELLQSVPNGRGATLSGGTVRHHLNALSNLYRRAQAEGYVTPGFNPVAALIEKPSAQRHEARWLEVHEAALLLEAAKSYRAKRGDLAVPYAHALLATFLLTGGRQKEVLGLEVEDVSFDRKTITFRPNQWRRLKTATSHRSVPLWPQLEESLREYVFGAAAPPGRLLFPSFRTGQEAMLTDFRKLLDAVAERAGWKPGEIRSKMFRHTYCAARLQTLDRGAPVSEFTVARELGHGGEAMVRRVYGHLGQVRQRTEVVEYRVELYAAILGDRLTTVRVGAGQT
jgi:integrase